MLENFFSEVYRRCVRDWYGTPSSIAVGNLVIKYGCLFARRVIVAFDAAQKYSCPLAFTIVREAYGTSSQSCPGVTVSYVCQENVSGLVGQRDCFLAVANAILLEPLGDQIVNEVRLMSARIEADIAEPGDAQAQRESDS